MTRDKIIEIAREAGMVVVDDTFSLIPFLERFAALVAAAERNRTWTQKHWTEYERSIAAAEREACAKVCEAYLVPGIANEMARVIRARN